MSQRPDTFKVLTRAVAVALEHTDKMQSAINAAAHAVANSTTLTTDDLAVYKEAMRTGQKLVTAFTKATEIPLPVSTLSPAKRGRPPMVRATEGTKTVKAKAPKTAKAAKVVKVLKVAKVAKVVLAKTPKVKAVKAAVATNGATAPKKRGRPPKVKSAETAQAATVVSQAAPKKRGRPKKIVTVDLVTATLN